MTPGLQLPHPLSFTARTYSGSTAHSPAHLACITGRPRQYERVRSGMHRWLVSGGGGRESGERGFGGCRRFQHDLVEVMEVLQHPSQLKEAVKQLYQKHVTEEVKACGLEEDVQAELDRQRNYLERTVETMKSKLQKDIQQHQQDTRRIMQVPLFPFLIPITPSPWATYTSSCLITGGAQQYFPVVAGCSSGCLLPPRPESPYGKEGPLLLEKAHAGHFICLACVVRPVCGRRKGSTQGTCRQGLACGPYLRVLGSAAGRSPVSSNDPRADKLVRVMAMQSFNACNLWVAWSTRQTPCNSIRANNCGQEERHNGGPVERLRKSRQSGAGTGAGRPAVLRLSDWTCGTGECDSAEGDQRAAERGEGQQGGRPDQAKRQEQCGWGGRASSAGAGSCRCCPATS